MTVGHDLRSSGHDEEHRAAPASSRRARALLLILLLGVSAGLLSVWLSRPEPPPPSDPWPAAIDEVAIIVRDTGPLVDRGADAARAAAEPMALLDRTRPLLTLIDGWRTISIRSRPSNGSSSKWLEALGIPDNAYDGVLAALDFVTPGTALVLRQLESVARRAVAGREALLAVAAELDVAGNAFESFAQAPNRQSAEVLASYGSRFKERADPLLGELSGWHQEVSAIAQRIRSISNAVRRAADTRIGRLVATELSALDNLLAEIGAPLHQYDGHQSELIRTVAETNVRLARVTAIVADARALEAGLPTERERADTRRVRQQLIVATVAGSLMLMVIAWIVLANRDDRLGR